MRMESAVARIDTACAAECPALVREALDLVCGKWAPSIFFLLHGATEPLRYAQLGRALEPITPKELTRHLRHLQAAGLIARRVHPTVPPKVDYALTDLGRSLQLSLRPLVLWAAEFGAVVAENRAAAGQTPRRR